MEIFVGKMLICFDKIIFFIIIFFFLSEASVEYKTVSLVFILFLRIQQILLVSFRIQHMFVFMQGNDPFRA